MYEESFEFNKHAGAQIMHIRLRCHYTREALAEIAEISPKYLYEIETGKKGCSAYIFYRIACALGVTSDYIINRAEAEIADNKVEKVLGKFAKEQKVILGDIISKIYLLIEIEDRERNNMLEKL